MRVASAVFTAALISSLATAQTPTTPPAPTISTTTRLVAVDITLTDAGGKPVHGLKKENFVITEDKVPQSPRIFEEHSRPPAAELPKLPALRPGEFTDYTNAPVNGALNVLLIDTLNTSLTDQTYLKQQLAEYVKHADPTAHTAVMGLSTRLYILQGFTADPAVLRAAVEHKLIQRASPLQNDQLSGSAINDHTASDAASDAGLTDIAASLKAMEDRINAQQKQNQIQLTVDAFNALGHWLATFPGRKNVVWFSGSFPIDIAPDPESTNPFENVYTNDDAFREMTNVLTQAQVAVYPVDARGLQGLQTFSAANAGHGYARNPQAFGSAIGKENNDRAQEHLTMEELASDTGGHAYYNTNDLVSAVNSAIDNGANYYQLAYSPTNTNLDGRFRRIRVSLTGVDARGYKISTRNGYFADTAKRRNETATTTATADPSKPGAPAPLNTNGYLVMSMSRGAPTPHDILFKALVLPASATTDDKIADRNDPSDRLKQKGPYRRYSVDIAALGSDFRPTRNDDNTYTDTIDMVALLFDADGQILNQTGRTTHLKLTPENYKQFRSGSVSLHLELSAPAKGESFIRIVLHDHDANRFGAVELSTAAVSDLPPAPPRPAPAPAGPTAPTLKP